MVIFVLIAIATGDSSVAVNATQTIGYFATASECQIEKNKIQPTLTSGLVKLDCMPIKATNNE